MGVTRPAERELDPIIATALKAVTTLTNTTADHWSAAVCCGQSSKRWIASRELRAAGPKLDMGRGGFAPFLASLIASE
jgi:hypothetical protein